MAVIYFAVAHTASAQEDDLLKRTHDGDASAQLLLLKRAQDGDADAQFMLGVTLYNGIAVDQDYAESVTWYRLAAEQGFVDAQYNLGYAYEHGEGVEQDYAEAVRWYRLAAEQGDAEAQNNLGVAHSFGKGVAQDYAEAVRWYGLAAEQGLVVAQLNLGYAYNFGEGVAQDYAEAVRWYRLAAEQGDAEAQFNLGVVNNFGEGVAQDYAEAIRWYRFAAGTPRVGHHVDSGSAFANEGLLIESEARTNLVAYSIPNATNWAPIRATISENVSETVAPDGSQTASKGIENTASGTHRIDFVVTLTDTNTYTYSIFAKAAERSMIAMEIGNSTVTGNFARFDLSSGSVAAEGGTVTSSIENFGNGWYRCRVTAAAGTFDRILIGIFDGATQSYAGDGSSGVFLWGAQLEEGWTPSTYIPTSGATATRAALQMTLTTMLTRQ